MKTLQNPFSIMKELVEKYKEEGIAPVVQGVFSAAIQRNNNPLYSKAEPVTNECKPYLPDFIELMFHTMQHEQGIGIAAPQLGVPLQLFMIGLDDKVESERYGKCDGVALQVFLNPRIIKASTELKSFWHGCLSAKGQKLGKVATYDWVECEAYDLDLNKFTARLEGMASIIFQHEFRHLLGKLYIDQTNILMPREDLREKIMAGEIESCEPCGSEVPHLLADYKIGNHL